MKITYGVLAIALVTSAVAANAQQPAPAPQPGQGSAASGSAPAGAWHGARRTSHGTNAGRTGRRPDACYAGNDGWANGRWGNREYAARP